MVESSLEILLINKEKLDMAIDMASMDNVLESYTNARDGGGRRSLRNDG